MLFKISSFEKNQWSLIIMNFGSKKLEKCPKITLGGENFFERDFDNEYQILRRPWKYNLLDRMRSKGHLKRE